MALGRPAHRPHSPAAAGDDRFVDSDDEPALHWSTANATPAGVRAMSDEFARIVDQMVDTSGAPFRLLEAYQYGSQLIRGCRAPTTQPGRPALPTGGPGLQSVLITAQDDESPAPAETYASNEQCSRDLWGLSVLGPGPAGSSTCPSLGEGATRLGRFHPEGVPFRCYLDGASRSQGRVSIFGDRLTIDYAPRCISRPIAEAIDGSARCRVTVALAGADRCSPARGMNAPLGDDGRPHDVTETRGVRSVAICELGQLQGEAGTRCRQGLDCTDCPSGWCKQSTPLPRETCSSGFSPSLRFIGGALSGTDEVHIACALEP